MGNLTLLLCIKIAFCTVKPLNWKVSYKFFFEKKKHEKIVHGKFAANFSLSWMQIIYFKEKLFDVKEKEVYA